ncbi:hypothetical protein Lser_V15G45695 [Lactuca serriola]
MKTDNYNRAHGRIMYRARRGFAPLIFGVRNSKYIFKNFNYRPVNVKIGLWPLLISIRFPKQTTISQNRFVSYPVPPPSYPPPSSLVATSVPRSIAACRSRHSPLQHLVTGNQKIKVNGGPRCAGLLENFILNWSVGCLPVTTVHRSSAGHHRPPAVELFCTSAVLSGSQN